MKGLSVWGLLPPLPAEFVQGGVYTWQWSWPRLHHPAQWGLELGGILSSKRGVILLALAWVEAEPAWLTWGGAHSRIAELQSQSWAQPAWQRTPP